MNGFYRREKGSSAGTSILLPAYCRQELTAEPADHVLSLGIHTRFVEFTILYQLFICPSKSLICRCMISRLCGCDLALPRSVVGVELPWLGVYFRPKVCYTRDN